MIGFFDNPMILYVGFLPPWPQDTVMTQRCAERARAPLPWSLLLLEEDLLKFCCYLPPEEDLILPFSPEEFPILLDWPCFVVFAWNFFFLRQAQLI